MAEIGQGHNSPPFDFNEFFDLVVSSPASAQQKLIQLVIARRAQKAGGKASPRRADILADASCSEATFKRSYGLLKAFFEVSPNHGATTEYTPKSCITITDIEAALESLTVKTKGHSDTGSLRTRYQKVGLFVIPGSKSEGLPDTEVSQSKGHGDTEVSKSEGHGDTTQKEIPPTPPKENTTNKNTPVGPHDENSDEPAEPKKRARQMPLDWQPAAETISWAKGKKIGATAEQIAEQFDAFRDFHQSKGNRFLNWDQAFQTWMRKAKQFGNLDQKHRKMNGSYSLNGTYTGELL